MGKPILKNLCANFSGIGINLFCQVILVPFYIEQWGVDKYADWIVLSSVSSVFSMSDIGLNTVISNQFSIKDVYKRQIFMGDTGSLTLGYMLAFLTISYATVNPQIHPYFEGAIIVAFAPLIVPAFDVFRVMLIRARNHKPLFIADRNHIHHKCLDAGLTCKKEVVYILGLACVYCILNMALINTINNNLILFLDILLWSVLILSLIHIW